MSTVSEHFRKVQSELRIKAEQAGIFGQDSGDVGSVREHFIKEYLQRHLPQTALIGTGIILDFDDSKSRQMDIIIYSAAMPKIVVAGRGVFLRESIFATIEAKSYLNKDEIERSLLSINSFKSLKIASPQYTPMIAPANGESYIWDGEIYEGQAASYVFAYDGLALDTVVGHLADIGHNLSIPLLTHGPDLVCVLNKGVIAKNDGRFLPKQEGAGQFASHDLPDDVLLVLFIHILNTISSFGVLPYDFAKYLSFSDLNKIRGL